MSISDSSGMASNPDSPSPSTHSPLAAAIRFWRTRTGWQRRLVTFIALLTLLFLFRAPLLRFLGGLLIYEDPHPSLFHIVPLSGDQRYDRAAVLFRTEGARDVLVFDRAPSRLVSLGVLPTAASVDRLQLTTRGVPSGSIVVLPGPVEYDWDRARVLRDWLLDRHDDHVLLLCERFGTRRMRYILNRVLGDASGRAHLLGLPSREYAEGDWWHHKNGLLDFFNSALALCYTSLGGDAEGRPKRWDPDLYEKSLR